MLSRYAEPDRAEIELHTQVNEAIVDPAFRDSNGTTGAEMFFDAGQGHRGVHESGVVLFQSFFLGGFECSTHRVRSGRRLDLIRDTGHDAHVRADYARLREMGILAARDGIRWHLIEQPSGRLDFSSALPMVRAARDMGIQVTWDLCHYGWPDHIDVFSPAFIRRFAALARGFASLLTSESDAVPFLCPINEISFLAWAGNETGWFFPHGVGRGDDLKVQLVRASIAAIEAVWDVAPRARIVHVDPAIHVTAHPARPRVARAAERYRQVQYAAWDMLGGRLRPELGGHEKYLDIIGINYYPHNQFLYPERTTIWRSDPRYRPLRHILGEVYQRYRRPTFIAETGCEGKSRCTWLSYVGREVRAALRAGVPIQGICLYPVIDFPGWDDHRHRHEYGMWGYPDHAGNRATYWPLAAELQRQVRLFEHARPGFNRGSSARSRRSARSRS